MLTQVADIQVTLTASALEAAVLEGDLIKELSPPYNVQLTGAEQGVFYANRDFTSGTPEPDESHVFGPVPSELSLRPLAALAQALLGEWDAPAVRAQVVGMSALWPPDAQVFAEGWQILRARRPSSDFDCGDSARRAALRLARRFLLNPAFGEAESIDEGTEPKSREWDPVRVARHIETACAEAYRAFRRARWLWLLANSEIVYREPSASQPRLLVVAGGAIVLSRDESAEYRPAQRVRAGALAPHFDRKSYDRLRVLTTELKRIARDGGEVRVHWGPGRSLSARALAGVLAIV
jgi:hypothetical protein